MTTTALDQVITFDMLSADLPPAEEKRLWRAFEKQLASMDDSDAQSHLKAGRPIYYHAEDLEDRLVREWPDGRREYVDLDENNIIISLGAV